MKQDLEKRRRSALMVQLQRVVRVRFSLNDDRADDAEIESRIRDGVELRGATPWILMFAIFVASVGLNVNSTAVIIGAMLMSPLMGPIMGAGLGIAVYDYELVKRSLTNLGVATLISLLVSAVYFSLTPLQQTQSEVLARTSPTIWDVLIALFGGLAGIIGITRQEKSNVIPGVAIATALMPPVCTAGFGLATGQWRYFIGAFYLYAINCVFISLATVAGLRALRLKPHGFADSNVERRVKATLTLIALITAVPSAYLAFGLVKQEIFRSKAQEFISREFLLTNAQIVDTKIDPDKRIIDLSLIGDPISAEKLKDIEAHLAGANLAQTRIVLHQAGERQVDVTALKSSLLSDLLQESQDTVRRRDAQLEDVKAKLAERNVILGQSSELMNELRQLYPEVETLTLADGLTIHADNSQQKVIYLNIGTRTALTKENQRRLGAWLSARLKSDGVKLNFEVERKKS